MQEAKGVVGRLRPPPIIDDEVPSPVALKARIEGQAEKAIEMSEPETPKKKREYTFPFSFEAVDGMKYEGTFKNRILNVGKRMQAGSLAADLVGGRAFSSLPGKAQQLAVAISWMTFSLADEGRPDWAKNLNAVDDEDVIFALYAEVWDHQSTFLGRANNAEQQAG